jgi:hypothetical protein
MYRNIYPSKEVSLSSSKSRIVEGESLGAPGPHWPNGSQGAFRDWRAWRRVVLVTVLFALMAWIAGRPGLALVLAIGAGATLGISIWLRRASSNS